MVGSPENLAEVLDECFRPLSMETVDCTYRTVLWLAFVGFPREEIENLMATQINTKERRITYKGVVYPLPEESIKAIFDSARLKYFTVAHRTNKRKKRTKLPRTKSYLILRSIRGDISKLENVMGNISDAVNAAGYHLTYERVRLSGVFWRAYERTLHGAPADLSEEFDRRMAAWKPKGEVTEKKRHIRELMTARDIRREYADWLSAFHYTSNP